MCKVDMKLALDEVVQKKLYKIPKVGDMFTVVSGYE